MAETDFSTKETVAADEASSAQQEAAKSAGNSTAMQTETVEAGRAEKKVAAVNGRALYVQKCASCHGISGEKVAFNQSKIIAGWDKERSMQALKGYQDGSYGGSLKGIMKGQVESLNEKQMEAISESVSTL
ncbi:MAG: c-type cytochrome [Thiovulaceae bacterium]|nr:c-type cytochrome [Sulfurimonadaceae bacterium]